MRQPGQLRALLATSFCLCVLTNTAVAQRRPIFISGEPVNLDQEQITVFEGPPLKPGASVERKLGPREAHAYSITLEENTYIQLVVEQRGIDLTVEVSSPAGKNLGEFDSPNGTDGPEAVSFVAVTAGVYRVVVSPLNEQDQTSGMYEIKIVELRAATEQEIKTSKNVEVVKAKGLALLNDIEAIIAEIRSPQTRIRAQMQAAQLLWSTDEKRASKYLNDAANGVKEFLTADPASSDYTRNYGQMGQLRSEIVGLLMQRDPEAALEFLRSSRMPLDPYGNEQEYTSQEMALELGIATQISANDPKRALQIARQSLKKGYSSNLPYVISQLKQKNPELATEFANEVVTKLLGESLLKTGYGAYVASNLTRGCRNPQAEAQKQGLDDPSVPALLSADTCRELLQKSYREALSYTQQGPNNYSPEREAARQLLYGLRHMGPELDTLINGGAAAVTKKISELDGGTEPQAVYQQVQQKMNDGGPMDGALELIEKAPAEMKESLYTQFASNTAIRGDAARARQIINEKISNPFQRRQALQNIDSQEVYQFMQRGKVEDALRTISGFRTPRDRASMLGQIARQIGPGQKRATAMNLLEQARALLGPGVQAQDQEQMNALLELARAFARYDAKRAFEIAEPLVDQANEICAAARTLDGFGPEYYQNNELDLQNGNSVANVVTQISGALGTLAISNFERAKSTADRLRLPEARLRAYLDIAQQTIQAR